MGRKIELPVEEIVSKWENGATQQELADEYGITRRTIIIKIKEWYEEKGKIKSRVSGRNRIELPMEEIVLKWENGATQQELADEYGISRGTVITRIKEWYEKKEKIKPKTKRDGGQNKKELPMEEIVSKWENGATQQELADEYGITRRTINTRIKEWYEEKGKIKPRISGKNRIELPMEEIVSKWENGTTLKELVDEYGTSFETIRTRIKEWYEKKEKIKPKTKRDGGQNKKELPMEEIVSKWENGATQQELADEYGISRGTVITRINKWYEENGKEKPQDAVKRRRSKVMKDRVIRGPKIVIEYLKKGATPEQILEIAQKNRVIIPDSVMQEAIKKAQEIPEERIQKDVGRDIDE